MNTSKPTTQVSIVGYGRFGKVLHRLLKDDFSVTLYTRGVITDRSEFNEYTSIASSLDDVYKNDVIFYAVPIASFDNVMADHKKYFRDNHLLIDVLSVKLHPAKVFEKHLKGTDVQALLTHPMFGPDSSAGGFGGLPIIIERFRTSKKSYEYWKRYFSTKKLHVIEMSAREHDRLAASSQGLTHFIGRLLKEYGVHPTPIDSQGAKKLLEIVDQTCNDTWELFTDLQLYNPYTKHMRMRLREKFDRLHDMLMPRRVHIDRLVFGIQGGKGSFNEEVLMQYVQRENISRYKVKYLHTSENVMKALSEGSIDRGQFAIHNSAGGIVDESIHAMAEYRCKIVDTFSVRIAHALMIRRDADVLEVTTIMTHPQVLAQCKNTLASKYPFIKLTSGKGNMIDHALVAKHLGEKRLPKHIATMGSRILADIYGLKVIDDNLQDLRNNETSFMQVERI